MPEIPLIHAILGGLMIGLGLGALLLFNGQVGGISGAFTSVVRGELGSDRWKLLFVIGVVVGGGAIALLLPAQFEASRFDRSLLLIIASGLAMGFGGRMCNGCTSGHGLCGIARFSRRSMVATATFFGVALLSTFVLRHGLGVF